MITIDVLNGLLTSNAEERKQAEQYYQSLPVHDRCRSLLELLCVHQQEQLTSTQEWLLAVLLRRDIMKCTDPQLLNAMIDPLLQRIIVSSTATQESNTNTIRLQMGYCCAEICATLSMIQQQQPSSSSSSEGAVTKILQALSGLSCQGDIPTLRILAELADRSSSQFAKIAAPSLPQLITSCCNNTDNNSSHEVFEALMNVLVSGAIATESVGENNADSNDVKVDPTSIAAQLGSSCLLLLASKLTSEVSSNSRNKNPMNNYDSLQKMLQYWSHAATTCPSLLAGDQQVLQGVLTTCLQIVSVYSSEKQKHDDDERYDTIQLSSLQVLSSLLEVDDIKRKIIGTIDGTTLQSMIVTPIVTSCVELIATGVDDDIDSWAGDVPLMTASAGGDSYNYLDNWEEDDVAMYAEELLESILHSLGGGLSFPVVLPLVEKLLSSANNENNNWRYQRAALSILECCLSGAPITFLQYQPIAIQAALTLGTSSNQNHNIRVQYQAIRLLGAMCENDNRIPQKQYTAQLLQVFAEAAVTAVTAQNRCCPKLSCIACMALVSFCRGGCGPEDDEEKRDEIKSLVVPYLSDLLSALASGPLSVPMNNNTIAAAVMKQKAVGAIACLAEATDQDFIPHYNTMMSHLLACCTELFAAASQGAIGRNSGSHEIAMLIGSSLEAATIVGQALGPDQGRDIFRKDAQQIIQFATTLLNQQKQLPNNNMIPIPMDQVLSACARIASIMGMEYAPFVDVVLPHLLERAMEPPDVSLSEGTEADLDNRNNEPTRRGMNNDDGDGMESMTVTIPGKGITKVTVNTTKIQEKAMAARAVYEHAQALGEGGGFTANHLKQCFDAFIPLLNFQFSSEVRSTSAQTIAAIFEASCSYLDHNSNDLTHLPQNYFPAIVKAMGKQIQKEKNVASEDGMETLYAFADALSEVFYSVYSRCRNDGIATSSFLGSSFSFNDAHMNVNICIKAVVESLNRRKKIRSLTNSNSISAAIIGEDEKFEIEMTLKQEGKLLVPLIDSIGYTLKLFQSAFVPIFEKEIVSGLGPYLSNTCDDMSAKFSAICLFDDCIEHCGSEAANKFSSMLIQGIMTTEFNNTNNSDNDSTDEDILRASLYGIAQIARYASPNTSQQILGPYVDKIFHLLVSVIKNHKGDVDGNDAIFENAISAIASLTLIGKSPPFLASTCSAIPKREDLINIFLDNVPLREDEDEAKICHDGLCTMIESGSIGKSHSPKILRIIGEIFQYLSEEGENTIVTEQTASRFLQILMQMQRDIPSHHLEKYFVSLRPSVQQVLNGIMSNNNDNNQYHHGAAAGGPKVVTP